MKIYWSSDSVPEIASLPQSERAAAFFSARVAAWERLGIVDRVREVLTVLVLATVTGGVVAWLTGSAALGGGVGGGVGAAVGNHRRFARVRAAIQEKLAA